MSKLLEDLVLVIVILVLKGVEIVVGVFIMNKEKDV